MSRHGFHTITLGCKLNQFDGAAIEGELARRGFAHQDDPALAEVVIVNTCTVTHRADADARKIVRRIRRNNPGCRLLVTGCYAERDAAGVGGVGGIDRVFGNRDKPRLGAILDELGIHAGRGAAPSETAPADASAVSLSDGSAPGHGATDRGCDGFPLLPGAVHFGHRSRAFLKVQDGCRLSCSYCIIPSVRGSSRSVPPDELIVAASALFESGYREIVLTGVNTGDYGRDLEPRTNLAALLRQLLALSHHGRIRLNSLEPLTVTDEIVELMASNPRLCPHLQVPLQSGSAFVLRAMRRNYRLEAYLERLQALRRAVPLVGLGADVIVGFPGETDAHFEETLEFIAASPLNYLHVFSWSPRGGTPAAELEGRASDRTICDRSTRLRGLAETHGIAFRRRLVGLELEAVVLGRTRSRFTGPDRATPRVQGGLRALTGNYVEVGLPPESATVGELVRVRIDEVPDSEGGVRAHPVGHEAPRTAARPSTISTRSTPKAAGAPPGLRSAGSGL